MSELSRREAVMWAAGLAAGAGLVGGEARGDEKPAAGGGQGAAVQPQPDADLEQALKSPLGFMFSEQLTFKLQGDSSHEMVVTSARGVDRKPTSIYVRSATLRIFRADAGVDALTRQGGVYWRFHNQEGTLKFKQPGALVMIVREHDDTVRCYSLVYDERC